MPCFLLLCCFDKICCFPSCVPCFNSVHGSDYTKTVSVTLSTTFNHFLKSFIDFLFLFLFLFLIFVNYYHYYSK